MAPLGALVFERRRRRRPLVRRLRRDLPGLGDRRHRSSVPSRPLPEWFSNLMLALNITVGGTMVFTLLALFAKQREEALGALKVEHERAETLLLNILPGLDRRAAEGHPGTIADQFTAGVGPVRGRRRFHAAVEALAAADVVGLLDRLFSQFDALAERYGLEKIKTIGDAYMVAVGRARPASRPCHARWPMLALDMVAATQPGRRGRRPRPRAADRDQLRAGRGRRDRAQAVPLRPLGRRGQHRQPHGVAGHAEPDPGHRARRTSSCADEFELEPRGLIEVKGKGEMDTWYLVARKGVVEPEPAPAVAAAAR